MNIKAIVSDVDGSITDGRMYISQEGHMFKAFEPRFGDACFICKENEIDLHFITAGRNGYPITKKYLEMFGIESLKLTPSLLERKLRVKNLINTSRYTYFCKTTDIIYYGDAIWDAKVVEYLIKEKVKPIVVCPQNASEEMKDISDFVLQVPAGSGAFYQMITMIKKGELEI